MIESLEIKNFESHAHTILEFHPGINAIVGSSDCGKTSILRSLYWVLQNAGSVSRLSHWIKKKDGSLKGEASVGIVLGGKTLARVRNQDRNGYDINGQELSAIGRDTPEGIVTFLNMSYVNIGKQFDKHFLISETPGEVARKLNEMVKLDIIDSTLSKVESLKRECRKFIVTKAEDIAHSEETIANLAWVDKAEPLIKKCEGIEKKKLKIDSDIGVLTTTIALCNVNTDIVNKFKALGDVPTIFGKVDALITKKEDIKNKISKVNSILESITKNNLVLEKFNKVKKAKRLFTIVDDALEEKGKIEGIVQKLKIRIAAIEAANKDYEASMKGMEEVKALMPSVCPLCGNKMEESNG